MNKRPGSNARRSLVITAIAGFLLMFAASTAVRAQGAQFKVGDRVEVDTLQSSTNPEKSFYWRGGTITSIGDPNSHFGYYIIKIDEGGTRTIRFIDTQWIRAGAGGSGGCTGSGSSGRGQGGGRQFVPAFG